MMILDLISDAAEEDLVLHERGRAALVGSKQGESLKLVTGLGFDWSLNRGY